MSKTIILISGSRKLPKHFKNGIIKKFLRKIDKVLRGNLEIRHGNCAWGIDALIKFYCLQLNIDQRLFPADWDKYGKRAGYIRNNQMFIEKPIPDYVICIYGDINHKSNGTKSTEKIARNKRVPMLILDSMQLFDISEGYLQEFFSGE